MKNDKNTEQLKNEKIPKLLIKLSTPAIIGMIVGSLYNLIDTMFVGQSEGALALGGMAIAYPLQMTLMAVSMLFGVGASSLLSIYIGEDNKLEGQKVVANMYTPLIIINILIMVFGLYFLDDLIILFGATEDIISYARDYLTIMLYSNILFSITMASNNLLRAEGNAKMSMKVMTIGIIINLILDPIFIFDRWLGLGIKGAAYATAIGYLVSFAYLILFIMKSETYLKVPVKYLFKLDPKIMIKISKVGFPSFIRNFIASFVSVLVFQKLREYGGETAIGVYGTVNKVVMFVFMPSFGIIQGMQPIIGYNYGAKRYDRVLEVLKLGMKIMTTYFIIGVTLIFIFPSAIISIFTTDENFIELGRIVIRIMMAGVPLVSIPIVSSIFFQATGQAKEAFIISMSRQFVFFIPLLFILTSLAPEQYKLYAVFLTYPISDLLGTMLAFIIYRKNLIKIKKEYDEILKLEEQY